MNHLPVRLRKFLWENGLTLVLLSMFVGTWVGQIATGFVVHNEELHDNNRPAISLARYLTSGAFVEATAENWDSEFLQMSVFILLTICLRQKGSAESKKLDGKEDVDEDPREHVSDPEAPWPVKKGGWVLWLYANSLSFAFLIMFLGCFIAHAWGGSIEYSEELTAHGEAPVTLMQYLGTARFWFESLQNWQSEFLSIAAMVLLTIWLRQQGSPESKPVALPHARNA